MPHIGNMQIICIFLLLTNKVSCDVSDLDQCTSSQLQNFNCSAKFMGFHDSSSGFFDKFISIFRNGVSAGPFTSEYMFKVSDLNLAELSSGWVTVAEKALHGFESLRETIYNNEINNTRLLKNVMTELCASIAKGLVCNDDDDAGFNCKESLYRIAKIFRADLFCIPTFLDVFLGSSRKCLRRATSDPNVVDCLDYDYSNIVNTVDGVLYQKIRSVGKSICFIANDIYDCLNYIDDGSCSFELVDASAQISRHFLTTMTGYECKSGAGVKVNGLWTKFFEDFDLNID